MNKRFFVIGSFLNKFGTKMIILIKRNFQMSSSTRLKFPFFCLFSEMKIHYTIEFRIINSKYAHILRHSPVLKLTALSNRGKVRREVICCIRLFVFVINNDLLLFFIGCEIILITHLTKLIDPYCSNQCDLKLLISPTK